MDEKLLKHPSENAQDGDLKTWVETVGDESPESSDQRGPFITKNDRNESGKDEV